MTRRYLTPVVERVFNELKGHVNKDSLSQVLLLFVTVVKDNLSQVRILPYQHPHRRVKHLVEHMYFCWSLDAELQRWLIDNTWVPRRPGIALLLRIASFHWLLIMIVWIACNSLSFLSIYSSLSLFETEVKGILKYLLLSLFYCHLQRVPAWNIVLF